MHHGEIAGVEPTAAEGLFGRGLVVKVTLHDVVAAHYDLAHRRRVGEDIAHLLVDDADPVGRQHVHALACLEPRSVGDAEVVPFRMPLADRDRAVGLRQAVEVVDLEAERLRPFDHGRWRRRSRRRHEDGMRQRFRRGVRPEHHEHGRCPVQVGDAFVLEESPDQRRVDLVEADMARAGGGYRPREAPAVAVKHRQRPEIDGAAIEPRVRQFGDGIQVRAAMCVHDALRSTRRTARVVDADRVVL